MKSSFSVSRISYLSTIFRTLLCSAFLFISSVHAQEFPNKSVSIAVPFSAGGATDTFIRSLARSLTKELGQPVIVENKPGANGIIAAQHAVNAKPDGYTLATVIAGVFRQPYIQPTNLDPLKDLTYVAMLTEFNMFVVTKEDSPWRSMRDMVEHAHEHPEQVFYGVPALMGTQHLTMLTLGKQEGVEWTAVPFKGDAQSLMSLMSGDISASVVAGNVSSFEQSNKIRVLSTLNEERSTDYPNVSTLKEEGFSISASAAVGLAGPANMPPEVTKKLSKAIESALQDQEHVDAVSNLGVTIRYMNQDDYDAYARATYEESAELIGNALEDD